MNRRLAKIAERAASSLSTVQTSYDLAKLAIYNRVPGDFVECGVYHGAQSAAMALAIMDARAAGHLEGNPRVHLFDSFEGVPAPGEHDHEWKAAGHPAGQSAASITDVQSNMQEWGIDSALLVYHPGYFDATINFYDGNLGVKKIAVLRLDCDLYESTRVCLQQLYPLVSVGGWVSCDDFALDGARKAILEYFLGRNGPGIGLAYFQRQA